MRRRRGGVLRKRYGRALGASSVKKFYATLEYIGGQPAAVVGLTDTAGKWAGTGRVEVRSGGRDDLYEAGHERASQMASSKGGRLECYRVVSHHGKSQ